MNRFPVVAAVLAGTLALTTACTTKKTVVKEVQPTINKVNELDDLTAQTTRDIRGVDQRAQKGIQGAHNKANEADQHAASADQAAQQAQQLAMNANNGVNTLADQVVNLDNYRPVNEASVKFGFNKSDLDKNAKKELDSLAAQIPNTKGYIVALEGSTDSVGSADYNYELSQRRAASVIQYLASKYNIPANKIYVIGLGKDKPLANNKSSKGRAENRRVDVRLMTNVVGQQSGNTSASQ